MQCETPTTVVTKQNGKRLYVQVDDSVEVVHLDTYTAFGKQYKYQPKAESFYYNMGATVAFNHRTGQASVALCSYRDNFDRAVGLVKAVNRLRLSRKCYTFSNPQGLEIKDVARAVIYQYAIDCKLQWLDTLLVMLLCPADERSLAERLAELEDYRQAVYPVKV